MSCFTREKLNTYFHLLRGTAAMIVWCSQLLIHDTPEDRGEGSGSLKGSTYLERGKENEVEMRK